MAQVTKQTLIDTRARLQPLLDTIGQELGVTITTGRGNYGGLTGKLGLVFEGTAEDGTTAGQRDFERYATAGLGFLPEHFGAAFNSRGRTFTITGYSLTRRKFSIQTERDDGKVYFFPEGTVARLLGLKHPVAEEVVT